MMAHEDKVSNKCDYALYSATRNIERAIDRIEQTADACWPDIEKQCSETAPGGGRVAQCLVAKKATRVQGMRSRHHKFPATKGLTNGGRAGSASDWATAGVAKRSEA